jgi:hypothetical protein
MHAIDFNPTPRQLRQFAFAALVVLPLAAWLFCGRPWGDQWQASHAWLIGSLAAAGALLVVLSYAAPRLARPAFIGMSLLAFPIGLVVGEVMMAAVYFLVFTPVALLFRLIGRDALDRKSDPHAESYWRPKAQPRDTVSYFRQS